MKNILLFFLLIFTQNLIAQDTIRVSSLHPNGVKMSNKGVLEIGNSKHAALEIVSKSRGFLLPRLDSTAMRGDLADGSMFYSTYYHTVCVFVDTLNVNMIVSSIKSLSLIYYTVNAAVGVRYKIPDCNTVISIDKKVGNYYINTNTYILSTSDRAVDTEPYTHRYTYFTATEAGEYVITYY